jgi:hypothetical protein
MMTGADLSRDSMTTRMYSFASLAEPDGWERTG